MFLSGRILESVKGDYIEKGDKMKTLVTYYSRSGNTKRVAEEIAYQLDSDIDEIIDLKDRDRTIKGWLISGKDASKKEDTEIEYEKDPENYNLVIVGTPVWAWSMAPAVRTYLKENHLDNVAFFSTYGALSGNTFNDMEDFTGKPLDTLGIKSMSIDNKKSKKAIENFSRKVKKET
jgi:flavodoxin